MRSFFFIPFLAFVLVICISEAANSKNSDDRALLGFITNEVLNEKCEPTFIEIHMRAETPNQAGMALLKLFSRIEISENCSDKRNKTTRMGNTTWETFRYHCEQRPPVSVRTAIRQTILSIEDTWR